MLEKKYKAKGTYFEFDGNLNRTLVIFVHGFGLNCQMWQWLPSNVYNKFEKVILIDNTVSSVKKLPATIIDLLPNHTTFLVSKNNTYGRMNKGAGMLDSLKLNKEIVTDYDLIFYFYIYLYFVYLFYL